MKTFRPEEIDPSLPEVVKNFLASGKQLEEITLHADGRWTHEGMDFENRRITDLFSRSVARTEGGTWVLRIPPFTYPIEVEDTAYFVEDIDLDGESPHEVTLSDGTQERLALETMSYEPEGKLYCRVKSGEFRARFKKKAYYKLTDHFHERGGQIWLDLGETSVALTGSSD